jgi:hypothetical protein
MLITRLVNHPSLRTEGWDIHEREIFNPILKEINASASAKVTDVYIEIHEDINE